MSAENHSPMGPPSTPAAMGSTLTTPRNARRLTSGAKVTAVVMTIAAFALVGATGWMLITLADVLYRLAGE